MNMVNCMKSSWFALLRNTSGPGRVRGASKIKRSRLSHAVMKSMRANMDPMAYQQMMHQQQLAAIANARRAGKLQRTKLVPCGTRCDGSQAGHAENPEVL